MRHRKLISAAFLLTLAFQTADTCAASKVLFSDDFEQHAVGAQLGTLKPNVLVELVPELANELAGAMAASVSTDTELLRPLETRVSPFDVGTASQLFVDRIVIRDSQRIWFTQHQGRKHPANPVLRPDQPWEGWRTEIFGNVIYDEEEQLFKMWYLPEPAGDGGYFDDPNVTCYATSCDGVRWEKPLVGTLKAKNGKPHNAVAYIHQASVIKDLRESDPAQRYKNYTHGSPPVYRAAFEDGKPTGRKHQFSAAIGLVTWPLDRFVSVAAGSDGGTLTTIPVRHRGGRLELNAVVQPGGQMVAELLDAAGRPLEGIPPSEPLTGDNLRHIVRFAGQADVSATAGRAVVLRFTMKNAELYSFAFRGEPQPLTLKKTPEKLQAGQPVKIVCLGDSVTGIYYHTGGRRAYPEMLELALRMTYPKAEVTVVNAGISGNKTDDGLNRLQKDVLDLKPDLVTVMFGLNDLTVLPVSDYRTNLAQIVRRCRAVGAEVMLCTPNSVMTTPSRPVPKLIEYCHAIREVAAEQQAPVCDIHAAYEALRDRDPLAWRLLLSDEIHPNMDGHKLNAETLVMAITGQKVSLKDVGPPQPTLPKTRALVKAGKPVRVLAMEPLDKLIASACATS